MCEYCEPSMSFGNGGVSVGTRAIIDGDGDVERVNYLEYGKKWRVKCVKCADGRDVRPTDREVIGA